MEVTTTGRDTVPFGSPVPRSVSMPSRASKSFSTVPPRLATAHVGDLRSDVGTIAGQVVGETAYLPRQAPANETERREHQRDRQQYGWDPTDPPLDPGDGGRQDECQKDGERERYEDGLCPVQDRDDEHPAGERHPGLHGSRGVVQVPPPFLGGVVTDVAVPRRSDVQASLR